MSTEQLLTELKDGNPSEVPQEGHHRSLWSLQARGDVEEKGLGQTVNLLVLLLQDRRTPLQVMSMLLFQTAIT